MNHKFVDGHHIQHYSKGGETCLENLMLLCRHHHHLVHEGGFDCGKGFGGEIYFVDRRNERLADFQQAPRVSIEESLAWRSRKFEQADVSAETCKAKWHAHKSLTTTRFTLLRKSAT